MTHRAPAGPTSDGALASEELYEVVNGERREIPHMGALSGALVSILATYVNSFVRSRRLGFAVIEVLFELHAGRTQRRPDLAFVPYERWTTPALDVDPPAWNVVPALAVEVFSPINAAVDIEEKLRDYFAAGVRLVWVIYPMLRCVYVYDSLTVVRALMEADELDGGAAIPGFRVRIAELYAALVCPE